MHRNLGAVPFDMATEAQRVKVVYTYPNGKIYVGLERRYRASHGWPGVSRLFVLVLLVVRRWTASASSYMFVLFPVVTLALAAWVVSEPITLPAVIGAALVMAGVWFGALSATPNTSRPHS
jgi:hypothetical protein